ncbi:conserved hypothetical protein [Neospora caninum Liverpool]|uniref:Anaphase-promoting complex subunit 11 n=1 Tax=Neospora caninum (strain Liverpool) TaxID=572307 RepID=F0VAN6_NEOCL|nr:conserved hypothetical protein [Neospora caninum Liverpool]CBZ50791.1 conserved hypothetical protein [Neospora caninum Liverpool]CEL68092.1 TPA: Anaphase-promoting complex subunit 11 [Neospora caninum Liverpool]|eukprot:XP_003880824.1 conserved hypothetical protein [Neospora caninum Liverpool]
MEEQSACAAAAPERKQWSASANDLALLRASCVGPCYRVRVRHIHFVGAWRWAGIPPDEKCGICSNAFEVHCNACDKPGEACPPAFGACGHVFHLHCTWLSREDALRENQASCPLCRRPWRFKTANETFLGSDTDTQQSGGHQGSPSP